MQVLLLLHKSAKYWMGKQYAELRIIRKMKYLYEC